MEEGLVKRIKVHGRTGEKQKTPSEKQTKQKSLRLSSSGRVPA
jgi:hypothetical protein